MTTSQLFFHARSSKTIVICCHDAFNLLAVGESVLHPWSLRLFVQQQPPARPPLFTARCPTLTLVTLRVVCAWTSMASAMFAHARASLDVDRLEGNDHGVIEHCEPWDNRSFDVEQSSHNACAGTCKHW